MQSRHTCTFYSFSTCISSNKVCGTTSTHSLNAHVLQCETDHEKDSIAVLALRLPRKTAYTYIYIYASTARKQAAKKFPRGLILQTFTLPSLGAKAAKQALRNRCPVCISCGIPLQIVPINMIDRHVGSVIGCTQWSGFRPVIHP